MPRTILLIVTMVMEIKELLCTPEDACKGGRSTVTGKYPCSSKKENLGSKGEAVPALRCWRSPGTVKPLGSVQALKPFLFILQGPFSWAAAVEAAVPSSRPGQGLSSVSSGCC